MQNPPDQRRSNRAITTTLTTLKRSRARESRVILYRHPKDRWTALVRSKADQIERSTLPLPELAGLTVGVATVALAWTDDEAPRVVRVETGLWHFNADGFLDPDRQAAWVAQVVSGRKHPFDEINDHDVLEIKAAIERLVSPSARKHPNEGDAS